MSDGGARSLFAGILRLVPYSGIQFCDVVVSRDVIAASEALFTEELFEADGVPQRILLPLDARREEAALVGIAGPNPPSAAAGETLQRPRLMHPVTGKPVDPARVLALDGETTLKEYAGSWIPLPYLRFIGRDDQNRPRYDVGPSNWARAWISKPGSDASAPVKITLAFDTSLERHSRYDQSIYVAPNADDAAFGSTFICAESVDDLSPLLGEPWLESWLAVSARTEVVAPAEEKPAPAMEFRHRHLALYLTLLRMLAHAGVMPEARFTDTIQRRFPIRTTSVDLILDIGETETAALLVDVTPGATERGAAGGYAEPLRLRDLSAPDRVHEGPFPTAAEFNAPPFGDAMLSRESGRHDAFNWPSLVRVGHEARRLSLRNNGTEGVTGLNNLRSFLLDDAASPGLWRQSTDDGTAIEHGPMVSGLMLAHIGENGALLGGEPPQEPRLTSDSATPHRPALGSQRSAIRPRFSRASMVSFFASEIVLQALAQVNASAPDGTEAGEHDVRELRQIVVLAPAGLTPRERDALLSRVHAGVVLAWRGLGWDKAKGPGIPVRPTVMLGLGGELGTQVAFLHDEVTTKYQGRFRDLLRVYRGGESSDAGVDTLRVASVDFGARSTNLAIVDYAAREDGLQASEWEPTIRVFERLPFGTEGALQALIWSMILPAIERHLTAAGLTPARHFLDEITGRSTTSLLVEDPYFTRRLNRKILWPAARGLFALNEVAALGAEHGNRSVPLAVLVALGGGRLDAVALAFDVAALQAGARDFKLGEAVVALKRQGLSQLIASEMQDTISQVSRVIGAQACDLVLLTGEGARLPAVKDAVLAALPVAASRLIDLTTRVNRSVADAFGAHALSNNAALMPAIAVALERRNSLETSGFGAHALRRLGVNPQPNRTSDGPRALAGPELRETGPRETGARDAGARDGGRLNALPLKGA
jgi:hypothetical protein